MGLAQLQQALARLYTDPAARSHLQQAPDTFANTFQLAPEQLAWLQNALSQNIEPFAGALLRKRWREAAHSIPATRRVLGNGFPEAFTAFTRSASGASPSPAHDALAFLSWLQSNAAPARGTALHQWALYEKLRLSMRLTARRFGWGLFSLDEPHDNHSGLVLRLTIWWRWSQVSRLRHRSWTLRRSLKQVTTPKSVAG